MEVAEPGDFEYPQSWRICKDQVELTQVSQSMPAACLSHGRANTCADYIEPLRNRSELPRSLMIVLLVTTFVTKHPATNKHTNKPSQRRRHRTSNEMRHITRDHYHHNQPLPASTSLERRDKLTRRTHHHIRLPRKKRQLRHTSILQHPPLLTPNILQIPTQIPKKSLFSHQIRRIIPSLQSHTLFFTSIRKSMIFTTRNINRTASFDRNQVLV